MKTSNQNYGVAAKFVNMDIKSVLRLKIKILNEAREIKKTNKKMDGYVYDGPNKKVLNNQFNKPYLNVK